MADRPAANPKDYAIDLDRLPVKLRSRATASAGGTFLVVGVVLGGLPAVAVLASAVSAEFEPWRLWLVPPAGVGAGLFVAGLHYFTRTVTMVIGPDAVSQETKSVFGRRGWTAPLASFDGVLRTTEEFAPGGKDAATRTEWVVRLHHRDPAKRILLCRSESEGRARAYWSEASRRLTLPALEMGPDGQMTGQRQEPGEEIQ